MEQENTHKNFRKTTHIHIVDIVFTAPQELNTQETLN